MHLSRITKDKKGDVSDTMVILLITVFLAISFIVVIYMNTKIKEVITDSALNDTAVASTITDAFDTINTTTVQRGFVLFFSILVIGIIASAFLIRVHPAFLFLYIIVISFTIFVAVYMGNLYDDFTNVSEFATISADQPMINYIMENIVLITLAIGALSMIIVFAKLFGPNNSPIAVGGADI